MSPRARANPRGCCSADAELKNINLKEAPLVRVREGDIAAALDAEGEQILKNLPPRAYKIALCVEGKQLSSEELGALIGEVKRTAGELCFVIGSSHGLAERSRQRATGGCPSQS